MVTFLAGGTGTPKLLSGAGSVFPPGGTTVVGNTGDDVELGGLVVCPDLDTVLFLDGGVLDRETWWGIEDDSTTTHDELRHIAAEAGLVGPHEPERESGEETVLASGMGRPRFLPAERQTAGRDIADWRRFSGVGEFMEIGDRDRAVHVTRTSLLDEGYTLTEATRLLADAFGLERDLLPMTDDPVATLIHTDEGLMHFQEYWVARDAEPGVERVEFRGAVGATPTDAVLDALDEPVVIGPSNPVTSIGPMTAMDGFRAALFDTLVVAVSPFVDDRVFSGPAAELMSGVDLDPSTAGVAEAYPFADAFVLDDADGTELDRPTVSTDTAIDSAEDAERVAGAVERALDHVGDVGEDGGVGEDWHVLDDGEGRR